MAPTCALGHSDHSQDLQNQAGRASEGQGAGRCRGWRAACCSGDPGNVWKALGGLLIVTAGPNSLAVVSRKTRALAEPECTKLSRAAGRHHRKYVCVLWTKQIMRAVIQEGKREMQEAMKWDFKKRDKRKSKLWRTTLENQRAIY